MPDRRGLHHRRSIRLAGFDYAAPGSYFITICAAGRACIFGDVVDGEVILSEAGKIVEEEWLRSKEIRRELTADAFVVMPNHLHGIVTISHETVVVGAHGHAPLHPTLHRPPRSIGAFIARFKGAVTRRVNAIRRTPGEPVWQRNYYEHVVRDEDDFYRIVEYIRDNPRRWSDDEYSPAYRVS